jgi:hypothetical protein
MFKGSMSRPLAAIMPQKAYTAGKHRSYLLSLFRRGKTKKVKAFPKITVKNRRSLEPVRGMPS